MVTALAPSFLNGDCTLCDSSVRERQIIFENEHMLALYDYKAFIRGHCMILPKRHVVAMHEMSSEELISMKDAISKLFFAAQQAYQSEAYALFQKNGASAGQGIPHVHLHFFPRKAGDYSDLGLLARFYISNFKSPLSQESIDKERFILAKAVQEMPLDVELKEAL